MAISPVPMTRNTLLFPGRLRRIIERLAATAYPHEVCGLLLGESDGVTTVVEEVTLARNLNRRRSGYAIDPDDVGHAQRTAAEEGLEVVGAWYSRPDAVASPEEAGLNADLSNYSLVIVSVTTDRGPETRSWRLKDDQLVGEDVRS